MKLSFRQSRLFDPCLNSYYAWLQARIVTYLTEVFKRNATEATRLFGQLQMERDDRVHGACHHSFGKVHACTFLRRFVDDYKR